MTRGNSRETGTRHSHIVVEAIERASRLGTVYVMAHEHEVKLAEIMVDAIPCADRPERGVGGRSASIRDRPTRRDQQPRRHRRVCARTRLLRRPSDPALPCILPVFSFGIRDLSDSARLVWRWRWLPGSTCPGPCIDRRFVVLRLEIARLATRSTPGGPRS